MPGRIKILRYIEVTSTNDVAKSLAWRGEEEATAVLALSQTKGRGRGNNVWVSPPGGLYLSFILRPSRERSSFSLLSLSLALAAIRMLKKKKVSASLKWPNDILAAGKKIGGVLTEQGSDRKGERFFINGLGLNINTSSQFLLPGATSLYEVSGETFDIEAIAQEVGEEFFYFYNFWEKGKSDIIIKAAEAFLSTLGRFIEVEYKGEKISGFALALEKDGSLLIRGDNGKVMRLYSAFVRHLKV